ncbi:MAG: hypothetical protein R2856_24140 [Caldilineaceae bacterium]
MTVTDAGSGVAAIYYSTDGSSYAAYVDPFLVDPSQVERVHVFADDQVANRHAPSPCRLKRRNHRRTACTCPSTPSASDGSR